MKRDFFRKLIGGILLVSLIAICFVKPIQEYLHIPTHITLFEGQQVDIGKAVPVSASIDSNQSIVALSQDGKKVSLHAKEQGKNEMFLELAGLPVKKVDVNVLKDFKVVPGGQSIGVKLNTLGVLSRWSSPGYDY